eukprot:scaffold5665_cov114-Cylindrotheca_fusiformis.AAC.1
MEETDLHNPLLLESQKDAVVEHASQEEADKQHGTFQPMFLESQEDVFVDEPSIKKSKQCGAPIGKVRFGLIALVLAIAAVIAFCNNGSQPLSDIDLLANGSQPLSDIDLLANVVMPGVDISNLNETAPQYRALEWLAYNDTRALTDATELLERFSLATLYYSGGRGDWLTISSHCDWRGLFCEEDGRVTTGLDLTFKKLSGPIPSEIGHLQQLKSLELPGNDLSGPIPSEIGHLQQLKRLSLLENKFSGPIPSEIGHLQQLKILELDQNKFSGPIPSEIGHLQQLKILRLYQNKLSGPIPSEIGHLVQQLELLYLHNNKLSGPIPSEIGRLQQLSSLRLEDNIGLTGTVPVEVGQLKSISEAFFSNTSLTGGLDDLPFCENRKKISWFSLQADCGGLNPKITCECCTECCGIDENGRNPCDDF